MLKVFPLSSWNKHYALSLSAIIQHGSFSQKSYAREKKKRYLTTKGRSKSIAV